MPSARVLHEPESSVPGQKKPRKPRQPKEPKAAGAVDGGVRKKPRQPAAPSSASLSKGKAPMDRPQMMHEPGEDLNLDGVPYMVVPSPPRAKAGAPKKAGAAATGGSASVKKGKKPFPAKSTEAVVSRQNKMAQWVLGNSMHGDEIRWTIPSKVVRKVFGLNYLMGGIEELEALGYHNVSLQVQHGEVSFVAN